MNMKRRRWGVLLVTAGMVASALIGLRGAGTPARAATPGCASADAPVAVTVDRVACQEVTTHLLGDGIGAPFEYYVPRACDPVNGVKCPVLYLLHGFGGGLTSMLGQAGTDTSPW